MSSLHIPLDVGQCRDVLPIGARQNLTWSWFHLCFKEKSSWTEPSPTQQSGQRAHPAARKNHPTDTQSKPETRSTWIRGAAPRSEVPMAPVCFTGQVMPPGIERCTHGETGKREFLMGTGSIPADLNSVPGDWIAVSAAPDRL